MLFYEELFTRSQCNYCQQEIPGLGIECAECTTPPNFRMCSECFGLGAEIGQHKADHRYRVFDSGSLVIFPNQNDIATTNGSIKGNANNSVGWSAREEVRLLDAIEQYGFGNWQDISKHIETRTPSEAKEEYVNRFVLGATGLATWTTSPIHSTETTPTKTPIIQRPIDHTTTTDDSPLSPSLTSKLPPLDIAADEMLQLGYMPDRDDYEKEYDNDAEKLVSQLVFSPEDEEVDIALKLALVDIYSRRLRERVRRKRVIRDYQLVSQFFKKDRGTTTSKRRFAAYEKELSEKLKPFSQFHTAREHDHFIQNLIKEKELRFRIQELNKYRKNGIMREEDCIEYEKFKANVMRRRRMSAQAQVQAATENGNGRSVPPQSVIPEEEDTTMGMDEDSSHQKNLEITSDVTQMGMTMTAMAVSRQMMEMMATVTNQLNSEERKNDVAVVLSYPVKNLTLQPSSCDDFNLNYVELQSDQLLSPVTGKQPKILELLQPDQLQDAEVISQNLSPQVERQKDMDDQYIVDIESLPSSQLLSRNEQSLCVNINLLPSQYLTIKAALLLSPSSCSRRPSNLNDMEWQEILEFMSINGWITTTNSSTTLMSSSASPTTTTDTTATTIGIDS